MVLMTLKTLKMRHVQKAGIRALALYVPNNGDILLCR